jgi:hypothetical protein
METTTEAQRVKVGPFEWERRDLGGEERWILLNWPLGTHWCVKNYGGTPNEESGFSGWRLVSGGPFCIAGGWTAREDAMRGVIPFMRKMLEDEIEGARAKVVAIETALRDSGLLLQSMPA